EDALTFDGPRRYDADVVIVGSGLAALAVASRLVGRSKRIVILEAGDKTPDYEQQRELWGGQSTAANGPARDSHPLPHIGRVRALGGASTVWGGRCTPFEVEDVETRTDGSAPWPIAHGELSEYMQATSAFLQTGANDFTLEGSAKGQAKAAFLAPTDDPRIVERIERFSLPANAAVHFRDSLLSQPNITLVTGATAMRVMSNDGGTRVCGIEGKTSRGHSVAAMAPLCVLANGGIEAPRLLLSSPVEGAAHALGNQHDQVGRNYQTHIWGQVGQFVLDPKIARRVCRAERSVDHVYFRRSLTLSVEERRRLGVLAMCLRPSIGNLADPALKVAPYSLVYLARRFLRPEFRRHLEQYAKASELETRQLTRGHLSNLVLGLPQLSLFLARYTRRRLWARRREPGITQYHRNGIYGVEYSAEQEPNPNSRITLAETRDAMGMRHVKIDWRVTEHDRYCVATSLKAFRECLEHRPAASLRLSDAEIDEAVWALRPAKGHHMGTTRMSATPAEGVVDRDCQVWGVRGLYVAGSSVFPTSGYSNPTMPAVALSLRLGDHLGRQMGLNDTSTAPWPEMSQAAPEREAARV
ncbi:MAG: GMC family oxidoreductase, partial [Pseudomonadota bacterium]